MAATHICRCQNTFLSTLSRICAYPNISISLKVYCPNGSCDIWLVEVKNDSLKKSSVRAPSEHTVQTIELTRNLEFENPDYIGIRINLSNVGDIVFVDDLSLTTQ